MRRCLLLFLLLVVAPTCAAEETISKKSLPRSTPEAQGIASTRMVEFIEALDKIDAMNSVMVVRHGHVITEGWWTPYEPAARHSLYSLSKSFTSTAVGLAIAEGKLRLDDEVLKFFPDEAPAEPSANLKAMRVSDLLRMATGHQTEPPRRPEESWAKTFLAHPVPFKPGTHFLYNTSATYMASAIVQKATGMTVLDYLRPRLFEPLGIEDPTWEQSPQKVTVGGYGLNVRTEDIAKFGQLYLRQGKWSDKQLVPASWIDAATARQTSNGSNPASDWDQGYGYQFWRCRHGAYRGDGAFGQYCVVFPEQDAVLVITSGVRDMQSVLNVVWDKLLPAFQPSALPADEAAQKKLTSTLAQLKIRTPKMAGKAIATSSKTFAFPANDRKIESIQLAETEEGTTTITLRVDGVDQRVVCGRESWRKGSIAWSRWPAQPAGASGAWTADDTFTARICYYETPFIATVQLKFTGDEVRLHSESNVGFGPTADPDLIGKLK